MSRWPAWPRGPSSPWGRAAGSSGCGEGQCRGVVFTYGKDNIFIPVQNSVEELGKTGAVIDLASKGRFLYINFLLLWKYFLPTGLSRWGVFL